MSITASNSSAMLANMVRVLSNRGGNVTLPIHGVNSGFTLSHVKGIPASTPEEGVSVTRAVVLNSILKNLSDKQQALTQEEYTKLDGSTSALKEFMQYLKDVIESTEEYSNGTPAETKVPTGFIVNKIV